MNNNEIDFNKIRHPAEKRLKIISILISLAFFSAVSFLCVEATINDEAVNTLMQLLGTDSKTVGFLIKFGSWGLEIVLIVFSINLIYINKVFIGKSSVKFSRLIDSKYKDINDIVIDYCNRLKIKNIPVVYIETSPIDSSLLGVNIRSEDAFSIPSKYLLESNRTNDISFVEYLIARHIGHIYLRHNNLFTTVFTFTGRIIPFFGNLYERAMCYSIDNVVEYLIGTEKTLEGIFNTYYDKTMYNDDVDVNEIIEDKIRSENKSERLGRFLENINSEESLPVFRLEALLDRSKPGRLI